MSLINCHTACHYANCHYTNCPYANCHYAECHCAVVILIITSCHYVNCCYAKCHGAEENSPEKQDNVVFKKIERLHLIC